MVLGDESSSECTIDSYGLYKEATGGDLLVGDAIASYGINQITINNPNSEAGSAYYFEALTRGGASIRRQINVLTAPESLRLIEKLYQPPNFAKYDNTNKFTKALQEWWTNPLLGGGPLLAPLSTASTTGI